MNSFILKGNICYSISKTELKTLSGYVVCMDGKCAGVFEELPEKYKDLEAGTDTEDRVTVAGRAMAVRNSGMFIDIKDSNYEQVKISDGDILRISPQGKPDYDKFNFIDYSGNKYCKWWNYGYDTNTVKSDKDYSDVYIEDLKCIAAYQGYSPDDIDTMLDNGISPDEIEEYLYCWE